MFRVIEEFKNREIIHAITFILDTRDTGELNQMALREITFFGNLVRRI